MASSAKLTDEEIQQLAEDLRTKFILEHSDDIDQRDLKRLKADLRHALKFIRHNRENFDNAYNNMVESYKWRKSFGINDIKYEDIDENLWKSGMAMNHGEDKDGNPIAILNIHLHKKDSKKALMLQKWIAFCFEMHCRVYPDKKMLMMFDMSGAGLAQMDMDLIRFVVNSFKIYFPSILAVLLVYNMPWVLQAAWKIVQSWLSEGAASKVKFVTKETIQDFISPEHLLEKYGGYDQWTFDYQVERDRMLQLISSYEDVANDETDDQPEVSLSDDRRFSPAGDEEEGEDGGHRRRGGKQVRFSSGLPPTRQSRFGCQDEDEIPHSVSPDQQILQKGSSTTSELRRRQVTRLMNRQDSGRQSSRSPNPSMSLNSDRESSLTSAMVEEDFDASPNGTPPSLRRNESSTIGDLSVSPGVELQFNGKDSEERFCLLTLTNLSSKTVAYKIKTTAPLRYKVRPNLALVDGRSVAKVKVVLISGGSSSEILKDRFLVQTYTFDSQSSVPSENHLSSFWKGLPPASIKELRMRCRRITETSSKSPKSESLSRGRTVGGTHPPDKASDAQVARLVEMNKDLCRRMSRLQKLNYLTVLLLLVLIMVVFFY